MPAQESTKWPLRAMLIHFGGRVPANAALGTFGYVISFIDLPEYHEGAQFS